MEYNVYSDQVKKASDLVDQQQYSAALELLQPLLDSDLSDLDKAIMCHNIAVICEKMGDLDTCLAWYDHGIAYEEPYMRFLVKEHKAGILVTHGRPGEALALYEHLYSLPYAMESEKERFWYNITVLRNPRK